MRITCQISFGVVDFNHSAQTGFRIPSEDHGSCGSSQGVPADCKVMAVVTIVKHIHLEGRRFIGQDMVWDLGGRRSVIVVLVAPWTPVSQGPALKWSASISIIC